MTRSKTSAGWLKEHFSDAYVQKAKEEGLRSRAAYKLDEIQLRDKFLRPGMTVVDLGSAPGGWSQIVKRYVKAHGKVYALDILPQDPIIGVDFLQADFTKPELVTEFRSQLPNSVDWVLSDIAPNATGNRTVDQLKSMAIAEDVLHFATQVLSDDGGLLIKVFHGVGFEEYLQSLRETFCKVVTRKPKSSRDRSSEVYLLASGRNLG